MSDSALRHRPPSRPSRREPIHFLVQEAEDDWNEKIRMNDLVDDISAILDCTYLEAEILLLRLENEGMEFDSRAPLLGMRWEDFDWLAHDASHRVQLHAIFNCPYPPKPDARTRRALSRLAPRS